MEKSNAIKWPIQFLIDKVKCPTIKYRFQNGTLKSKQTEFLTPSQQLATGNATFKTQTNEASN